MLTTHIIYHYIYGSVHQFKSIFGVIHLSYISSSLTALSFQVLTQFFSMEIDFGALAVIAGNAKFTNLLG